MKNFALGIILLQCFLNSYALGNENNINSVNYKKIISILNCVLLKSLKQEECWPKEIKVKSIRKSYIGSISKNVYVDNSLSVENYMGYMIDDALAKI